MYYRRESFLYYFLADGTVREVACLAPMRLLERKLVSRNIKNGFRNLYLQPVYSLRALCVDENAKKKAESGLTVGDDWHIMLG
jgi:hypothetical protein